MNQKKKERNGDKKNSWDRSENLRKMEVRRKWKESSIYGIEWGWSSLLFGFLRCKNEALNVIYRSKDKLIKKN